jgi:hypothetical protein
MLSSELPGGEMRYLDVNNGMNTLIPKNGKVTQTFRSVGALLWRAKKAKATKNQKEHQQSGRERTLLRGLCS